MEDYLEFISAPNMWSRLKNSEDLFINLEKCVELYNKNKGRAAWNFEDIDVYKFKLNGFKIIRWIYNTNKTLKIGIPKNLELYILKIVRQLFFQTKKYLENFPKLYKKLKRILKCQVSKNIVLKMVLKEVNLQNKLINFMQIKLILQCWKHWKSWYKNKR